MNKRIAELAALAFCGVTFCACAPEGTGPSAHSALPSATEPKAPQAPAAAKQAVPDDPGPSYEVSIASAEADRVHALEQCSSKNKAEHAACASAADAAYDQARSAADRGRKAGI